MCNKCESFHEYTNPVSNNKFILEYSQELLTLNQNFVGGITENFIPLFGGVDLKPSIISTIRSGQISPTYNLTALYMNFYGCDFSCFNYPGCCFGHLGRDTLASSFTSSIKKLNKEKQYLQRFVPNSSLSKGLISQ